ncbi:MAG: TIGR02466 family protein, partial [Pseudomonadota bacterium]
IEEGDLAGQAWCEDQGYPGYTSYASLNDLPDRAPPFAELLAVLDKQADRFARAVQWELGEATLVCDSFWVNILASGASHSGHIHPNSVISGTCYVALPEGAGGIRFEDPRLAMMMAAPMITPDAPAPRQRSFTIDPKPGDVLMWESWLRHEVLINQSDAPRLSISFNYSLA